MILSPRAAWPMPYRRGSHCFSTMLTNVFADTGWDLSEELAYVIGGGLSLLFYRDGTNYYVNSRMHDLEHFFARRTGSRIEFISHATVEGMLDLARTWADRGLLPFLYCEARELSSFRGVLPWESVHPFGEHALPVCSVTPSGDVVCNDYLWSASRLVGRGEIETAASMPSDGAVSMACPARRFAVGRVVMPLRRPDMREVLALSLAETAELFLDPPNNTQGGRALKALERDIASLPDLQEVAGIRVELVSMATMLEKIGSGGGAGRHLYARGLAESSKLLGVPALGLIAEKYASLGGRWRRLSRRMLLAAAAPDPRPDWKEIVLAVRTIRRLEVETAYELLDIAGSTTEAVS